MAEPVLRSPLESLADAFGAAQSESAGRVTLREIPFSTQLTLRVDPDSDAARALAETIGGELPTVANTTCRLGSLDVLWMGPDEWLLVSSGERGATGLEAAEFEAALRTACLGRDGADSLAVVDVSAQRTIVELGGTAARTVLARGCALDLDERSFGPGQCVQTLLAQAQVVLQPVSEPDVLRIFVRASFAQYLGEWLLDASVEERLAGDRSLGSELAAVPA